MNKQMMTADESVRASIGLDAASDGDLAGLHKFLAWVEGELRNLAFAEFPDDIKARMATIQNETERTKQFIDGWRCSQRQPARGAVNPPPIARG